MEMINSLWCYYVITLHTYSKYPCHFSHMNYKHFIIWLSKCKPSHFQCYSFWKFIQTKVTPKLNRSVNIGMYNIYKCITVNQWQSILMQITPYPSLKSRHSPWHMVLSLVSHYWSLMKSTIVPVISKWESVLL